MRIQVHRPPEPSLDDFINKLGSEEYYDSFVVKNELPSYIWNFWSSNLLEIGITKKIFVSNTKQIRKSFVSWLKGKKGWDLVLEEYEKIFNIKIN